MSATPTSFVVVHPEAVCAEAIAAALGRYPGLLPAGAVTTIIAGQRMAVGSDVIVIHHSVPGRRELVRQLQRGVTRVVLIGGEEVSTDPGARLPVGATIGELAAIIRPGTGLPETTLPSLTHREREVLKLVAGGLAGKQVARRLGISPKTVERHKTRIYSKLGVPNQAAAAGIVAREAYQNGGTAWSLSSI